MFVLNWVVLSKLLNLLDRHSPSNNNWQRLRDLGDGSNAPKTQVFFFWVFCAPEFHTYLNGLHRLQAALEFTVEQWPASVQVQSKRNTPIEGFWQWKRQGEGHSIREAIFVGKAEGLFNPNNELHMCVFMMQHYCFAILTSDIVKFSTGCGHLLFRNGLTSFVSTGIIIAYWSKKTKSYLREHLLVICG